MEAAVEQMHGTTIISVRRDRDVAMAGDGQVTIGETVAKGDAVKIRRLEGFGLERAGVLVGFAGAVADAFTLLEKFEAKLKDSPENLTRASVELAKLWRSDRVLRRLESLLAVSDRGKSLMISGSGEVIEPTDGIVAIGSGGSYALAAARALLKHTDMPAENVAREALLVAAEICIYTNGSATVLTI